MRRVTKILLAAAVSVAAGCETTKPVATTTPLASNSNAIASAETRPVDKTDKGTGPGAATRAAADLNATGEAVTPEMIAALQQLSAEDFKTRQEALAKLEQAMAKHFRRLVQVQELMLRTQQNLADQLKQMTNTSDVDAQARVASLMEFNYALSRWAIDVMALPEEKRKEILEWGLAQERINLIAKAWSRRDEQRAAAAKELAKIDGDSASWVLAQLINDADREVALAAMDACYDRKPSPLIVDTLWNKAIAQAAQQFRPRPSRSRNVTVRGRMISVYDNDPNYNARMQDGEVAGDVLIKLKPAEVEGKLNAMFAELAGSAGNPNDYRWRSLLPSSGYEGGRTIWRLVDTFKPREAVPFMVKVLQSNYNDGYASTFGNNNEKLRYSSRIDAVASLIRLLGQDPDNYKMKKVPNYNDRWMIPVAQNSDGFQEENELVKHFQSWWKENEKAYEKGEKITAPAPLKDEKPATTMKSDAGANPATMPAAGVGFGIGGAVVLPAEGGAGPADEVRVRMAAKRAAAIAEARKKADAEKADAEKAAAAKAAADEAAKGAEVKAREAEAKAAAEKEAIKAGIKK